jgi:tetratricopeptide (TPR) repeat protein
MKRVFLILFAGVLAINTNFGQTPQQLLDAAKKATKGADIKKEKLAEVQKIVDDALKAPENQSNAEAILAKAKLSISKCKLDESQKALAQITGKPAKPDYLDAGLDAIISLLQAHKLNKDPKLAKDILKNLSDAAGYADFYARTYTDSKNYVKAYENFKGTLDAHDALVAAGQKTPFEKPEVLSQQIYFTGMLGFYSEKLKETQPIFERMLTNKIDSVFVYSALYRLKKEAGDKEGSMKILEQGRKRYPEESSLLFSEINYYLEAGQLDVLITKLKEGVQKEPKNPSLYFTLGNVYDQLAQKDPAKADENTKEAINWYNKTLEIDPKHADAIYSIGTFYYNKAAKFSQEMKKLESDFSKAGQKKFDEAEKAMLAEFDVALPYFQKAEAADPNNSNTLVALKEIYARKNDLKMSKEFKERLDNITAGTKNAKSYFGN